MLARAPSTPLTPQENEIIKTMRQAGATLEVIADAIGRRVGTVQEQASAMKVAPPSGWWTDERIKALTGMWALGHSASEMAAALGAASRNAVIGKLHRLGLAADAPAPRQPRQQPRARKWQPRVVAEPPEAGPFAADAPAPETAIPFSQLNPGFSQCRWVYGDVCHTDTLYCGLKTIGDRPYCKDHWKIMYRPIRGRLERLAVLEACGQI